MENITIEIGNILKTPTGEFVIISIEGDVAILCQIETTKIVVFPYKLGEIYSNIKSGTYLLSKIDKQVVDLEELSETEKQKFKKKNEFINDFESEYAPTFDKLWVPLNKINGLSKLIKRHNITKSTALRLIRKYLQSGRDAFSIVRKQRIIEKPYQYHKKTGKPESFGLVKGIIVDDTVREHFDEGIKYYLSGRCKSKIESYDKMLEWYYVGHFVNSKNESQFGLLPIDQIPTFAQYNYYLEKKLPKYKTAIAKTSATEFRNDLRPLYNDSLSGVLGPGDIVEMDECEIDINLVSEKNPLIGGLRPVLYLMIDVFSRMIIGFSISYENNSYLGLTNCFLSLLDDKRAMCKELGIEVKDTFWPSKILPNKIRTDYGSEYISYECERMMSSLGITHDIVPPATGSLKGVVEQFFNQMQLSQKGIVEGKGGKSYRHNAKDEEKATMNLQQYKKFALLYIIQHNSKRMKEYPLNSDMLAAGMTPNPTPAELWNFGIENYGNPRHIANEEMFKYSLLSKIDVRLTKKGITFKGLHYSDRFNINLDKEIKNLVSKSKKMQVKIDTRNINKIYRIIDNKLEAIPLSQRTDSISFTNWSLTEYEAYTKLKKQANAIADVVNRTNNIARTQYQEQIINNSNSKNSSKKRLRKNTQEEFINEKIQNRIDNSVFESDAPKLPYTNEEYNKEISIPSLDVDSNSSTIDNAKKALSKFEEDESLFDD